MSFKKTLNEHFGKFSASPFLFVGSGMSRRYLGVENWEELLAKFSGLIGESFTKTRSRADGDLTKTASILAEMYSEKWWDSDIKGDKEERYSHHLLKMDSPLKIEVADYLKDAHNNLIDLYEEEIELLRSSKIDGIITTNWDLFLETTFDGFSKFIGQDGLFLSRSHGIAEIYKVHGCASDPNSLVLTSEDYDRFRKKNPYLSSKLLTIFIEHPIIFLGYSLTDPHILEILEEIVGCFPEGKMDSLRENIVFVEWSPEIESPVLTESIILKTLPVKLIRTGSYKEIFEVLSEAKRRIPAHIFRKIKDELYELVITNDPKGKLYVKDVQDLDGSEGEPEFVVGYGAISKIKKTEEMSKQGLIGLAREDIVRDIIFNSGGYDSSSVVFDVMPGLLKGQIHMPIYKYIKGAGLILDTGQVLKDDLCDALKLRVGYELDAFRPGGYEPKRAQGIPQIQEGIEELYNAVELNLFLRMAVFVPPEKIDLDAMEKILKKHADDAFSSGEKSQFVKIVCVYDLIRYSGKYDYISH